MTYQPNFNEVRTRKRCLKAIGFLCGVMSKTKPREWSTRYIDKYLGVSSNPLSKYLRDQLLTCTDDSYRFGVPGQRGINKKYILNQEGIDNLRDLLEITTIQIYPIVLQVAKDDHLAELSTGNFTYNDKSNRLWHPLQRYRKQHRTQILEDHGYQHHYDIMTCAPQLIHQYSQQIPEILAPQGKRQKIKWQQGPMDLWLFALQRYLREKDQVREEIAKAMDLPIQAVKEIINALFAGAVISTRKDSDIYLILAGDLARIEWLKQDPYIQELISDIKCCWSYIQPTIPLRTKKNKLGQTRRLPVNSKQKWHLYFELERRVIDSVRTYLDERSIRYFLIHDGWSCDQEIDRDELSLYVKTKTGFSLNFEYLKDNNNITNIPYCITSLNNDKMVSLSCALNPS